MTCEKCRWFKLVSESKRKFNKAWDFRIFDGLCFFYPEEIFKNKNDVCSFFESSEIKKEILTEIIYDNKNKDKC